MDKWSWTNKSKWRFLSSFSVFVTCQKYSHESTVTLIICQAKASINSVITFILKFYEIFKKWTNLLASLLTYIFIIFIKALKGIFELSKKKKNDSKVHFLKKG